MWSRAHQHARGPCARHAGPPAQGAASGLRVQPRVRVARVPGARAGERSDMPGLAWLNALPDGEATAVLLGCCAAPGWARRVAAGRPYATVADLLAAAEAAWRAREDSDLYGALAGHPRIGERRLSGWSRDEQS